MILLALVLLVGKACAVGITMYFGMRYLGENFGSTRSKHTITQDKLRKMR